jgi:hypothetical protein
MLLNDSIDVVDSSGVPRESSSALSRVACLRLHATATACAYASRSFRSLSLQRRLQGESQSKHSRVSCFGLDYFGSTGFVRIT